MYGLDICPVYLQETHPNCFPIQGDLRRGLRNVSNHFAEGSMDYIHFRYALQMAREAYYSYIAAGIREHEWEKFIEDIYTVLRPGGFVECTESDLTPQWTGDINKNSAYRKVAIVHFKLIVVSNSRIRILEG